MSCTYHECTWMSRVTDWEENLVGNSGMTNLKKWQVKRENDVDCLSDFPCVPSVILFQFKDQQLTGVWTFPTLTLCWDLKITTLLQEILLETLDLSSSQLLPTDEAGLEKNFISLQAEENFPPAILMQISLQWGMVFFVHCMYFFTSSIQITKFPGKELPILPVFSRPADEETSWVLKWSGI